MLYVKAYGETVESVDLYPVRAGPQIFTAFHGKRQGYMLTGLEKAIGKISLKVITKKAERLDIRFSVDE